LPDVPTVIEQGYKGFETTQWYGLLAPAKTPQPVIKRLADEAVKATKAEAVKKRFAEDDAIAFGSTPAEFAAFIKQEQARWGEVVKKAKLKAD
jgi:tripartite-type tricarboxylate transporter receptor subunit TctC